MTAVVEVRGVTKAYGEVPVLRGVPLGRNHDPLLPVSEVSV